MENTIIELKFSLDTFYFLMSGILVMWMAAGFAMLEAGLVRSKNVLTVLMQCFSIACLVSVLWLLGAYSFIFGVPQWILSLFG